MCEIDWGASAAWAQVVVSLFAFIGLLYTLWIQNKTLKEQQSLRKLEIQKFEYSKMPFFTIDLLESNVVEDSSRTVFTMKIVLICNSNIMTDLNFNDKVTPSIFDYTFGEIPYDDKIVSVGERLFVEIEVDIQQYNNLCTLDETGFEIIHTVEILFKCAAGKSYSQKLNVNGNLDYHITKAMPIDS